MIRNENIQSDCVAIGWPQIKALPFVVFLFIIASQFAILMVDSLHSIAACASNPFSSHCGVLIYYNHEPPSENDHDVIKTLVPHDSSGMPGGCYCG